jgi:hypothetical protein
MVFESGGPSFGCTIVLGERTPGDLLLLGSGARALVSWHIPRVDPETTFVRLIDDFDDTEHENPIPISSSMGVREVIAPNRWGPVDKKRRSDDGRGTKDADLEDPMARRVGTLI